MKILTFSPHAFFKVHALPEALVAESLRNYGHEILTVNCNGIYKSGCLCMPEEIFSDEIKKQDVCKQCQCNRDEINKEFGFNSILIEDFITNEEINNAKKITNDLTPVTYIDFHIDGIPIGKYALYEFWLNNKLNSVNFNSNLWNIYKAYFYNAAITFYASKRMISLKSPDRITTYNSLYSVNRVLTAIADLRRIPNYSLHAGSHIKNRFSEMVIVRGISHNFNRHPFLEKIKNIPLNSRQINHVYSHLKELFNATSPWVYSIKNRRLHSIEIRLAIGATNSQKVLLAVMRSNDERQAAKLSDVDIFNATPLFGSQISWLRWLSDFARNNKNYKIVFRVHPREYPNKREKVTSPNANIFEQEIKNLDLPDNLYINLPSDNISLHDLLKISDVVLNNSSSVGLEASFFGIPVVGIGDDLYVFDPALQKESNTIDEYIQNIEQAIEGGWSFSRVIETYRWLNYLFSEVGIDISDGYRSNKYSENRALNLFFRALRKLESYFSPVYPVRFRPKPLKNSPLLNYAIINAVDNHIGIFKSGNISGNINHEYRTIKKQYRKIMKSISHDLDDDFLWRFMEISRTEASSS